MLLSIRDNYVSRPHDDKNTKRRYAEMSASGWVEADYTPTMLFNHVLSGYAWSVSVYRDGYRNVPGIVTTQWLGLDVENGGLRFEDIVNDEFFTKHIALVYPSTSYSQNDPRFRFAVPLSRPVDASEYAALWRYIVNHSPQSFDTTVKDTARLFYGNIGADHSLCMVNDNVVLDVDAILEIAPVAIAKSTPKDTVAERYGKTEQGSKLVDKHQSLEITDKERVVLECLRYVLNNWDTDSDYEQWLQLWMSAHAGSDGSTTVRDYILEHPGVYWKDGAEGQQHYINAWAGLEHRSDGYTVASLFWLARQAGWLSRTDYELSTAQAIYAPYIPDFIAAMPVLPNRLLLKSQTGTGKTQALIHLYERLDKPKTVVFVPSIKLAEELVSTLVKAGVPAELYRDDAGFTKTGEELRQAAFLVTTLQTFAVKGRPFMSDYRLVYIEESDQLLTGFALSGVGSHVSKAQALEGFKVLRDAYQNSEYVWGVDATMTDVTRHAANAMNNPEYPLVIYDNKYTMIKPVVNFVEDYASIINIGIDAIRHDKKVVFAVDRADIAHEIDTVLELFVKAGMLPAHERICITSKTAHKPEVQNFIRDANTHSENYEVIIYNSVMLSGVSITEVVPDVLLHIGQYLSPRNNLQLLNRFRRQAIVYSHYRNERRQYTNTSTDELNRMKERVDGDAELLKLIVASRTDNAQLQALLAAVSIADYNQQMRSPVDLFKALLHLDGRKYLMIDTGDVSDTVNNARKGAKAMAKEQKDIIETTWRNYPPIENGEIVPAEYTDIDIACANTHAMILRTLNGYDPVDVDPATVVKVVKTFRKYKWSILNFVDQEKQVSWSADMLLDGDASISRYKANVAEMHLLSELKVVFGADLSCIGTDARVEQFEVSIKAKRALYELVITRSDQRYETSPDFLKVLLGRLGLRYRRYPQGLVVSNRDEMMQFVSWLRKGELLLEVKINQNFSIDKWG